MIIKRHQLDVRDPETVFYTETALKPYARAAGEYLNTWFRWILSKNPHSTVVGLHDNEILTLRTWMMEDSNGGIMALSYEDIEDVLDSTNIDVWFKDYRQENLVDNQIVRLVKLTNKKYHPFYDQVVVDHDKPYRICLDYETRPLISILAFDPFEKFSFVDMILFIAELGEILIQQYYKYPVSYYNTRNILNYNGAGTIVLHDYLSPTDMIFVANYIKLIFYFIDANLDIEAKDLDTIFDTLPWMQTFFNKDNLKKIWNMSVQNVNFHTELLELISNMVDKEYENAGFTDTNTAEADSTDPVLEENLS